MDLGVQIDSVNTCTCFCANFDCYISVIQCEVRDVIPLTLELFIIVSAMFHMKVKVILLKSVKSCVRFLKEMY